MPAADGVIVKGVSTVIVELINQPDGKSANYFSREGREEIAVVGCVAHQGPEEIGNEVHHHDDDRRNDQVPRFQIICVKVS